MHFPTPENLEHVPLWRNYVCGQLSQASIGLLTPRIVLVGLRESGMAVTLRFLVDAPAAAKYPEINAIVEQFDDLTGNQLEIQVEIGLWRPGLDTRGWIWTYQRWLGEAALADLELLDERTEYKAAMVGLERDARSR